MAEAERGLQSANEIWQVEVHGIIYEAPFAELSDWIDGGSLQPDDKIRRGNLRWIEARKVPSLMPFFNAKARGLAMPVVVSTTDAKSEPPAPASGIPPPPEIAKAKLETVPNDLIVTPHTTHANPISAAINPEICAVHTDLASFYLCDGCGNGFCKACPRSYGGSVKICPMCGSMCRVSAELQTIKKDNTLRTEAFSKGFGANDFFAALTHPFKFKVSLFVGAILFALFSLGQSASSIGGIIMVSSALFCMMLANMLTFGVLANTVDNFSQGKLDENFMPDFDDFSIWSHVLHPFILSIGAYISSFGPFLVVLAIGYYLVTSTVASQMDEFQSEVERIPGTQVYAGRKTAEQSKEVQAVLEKFQKENEQRLEEQKRLAKERMNAIEAEVNNADGLSGSQSEDSFFNDSADSGTIPMAGRQPTVEEETERLAALTNDIRKAQLESMIGKSQETEERESEEMFKSFLSLAAPLVVIGFITLVWGLFYFPAACAVAGYTKSFFAAINPIVGLDTIRRLGLTYAKILLMGLALLIFLGVVGIVVKVVFAPFNLPRMGNLPATGVGSLFTFYIFVVFSCILGYALFKSADKFGLHK